jgi:hypothetical protein
MKAIASSVSVKCVQEGGFRNETKYHHSSEARRAIRGSIGMPARRTHLASLPLTDDSVKLESTDKGKATEGKF